MADDLKDSAARMVAILTAMHAEETDVANGLIVEGLLQAPLEFATIDKTSWINVDPTWVPTIPKAGERTTLADLIAYATS